MSRFILSPGVKKSLIEIKKYTTKKWGKHQAETYLVQLRDRMRWLAKNPKLGKSRPEIKQGYYSFPEGKHIIFYRMADSGIEIMSILHENMDVGNYF